MKVAEKNTGDKKVDSKHKCLKPPKGQSVAEQRKSSEDARSLLADQAKFMAFVMNQRLAPSRTELMKKGQKHQRVTFGLPWIIKPFNRQMNWVVQTKEEADRFIEMYTRKGSGCQVQQYLRGFKFLKVKIEGGFIQGNHPKHVRGKLYKLITVLVMMGVQNFELTVSFNSDTSYIIAARPL